MHTVVRQFQNWTKDHGLNTIPGLVKRLSHKDGKGKRVLMQNPPEPFFLVEHAFAWRQEAKAQSELKPKQNSMQSTKAHGQG